MPSESWNLGLNFLSLWALGLVPLAGARPRLTLLAFVPVYGATSIFFGQILPRVGAPAWIFQSLTWVVVAIIVWRLSKPSLAALRGRVPWVIGWSAALAVLAALIALMPLEAKLQVVGWGHDNSAHMVLVAANVRCAGFLFACGAPLSSLPSYLVEYPQGFSVAWAAIPGASASTDLLPSLSTYMFMYALTTVLVLMTAGLLAVALVNGSRGHLVAAGLVIISLSLGVWSHQFWSGFSSYLWAIAIILAYVVARESQIVKANGIWLPLAACTLIGAYYSHQLLFPFIAIYVVLDLAKNRGHVTREFMTFPARTLCAFLALVLLLVLAPRSAQGSSFLDQVVVEAGMEAIPLWVWVPSVIVGFIPLFSRQTVDRFALRWAVIVSMLLFGALALYALRINGYVSYYPMKLLTFLVLIFLASSAAVVVAKPLQTRANQAWFSLSGLAVLGLAIIPPLLRYPGFKTAYQGSTPAVIRTLAQDPFGGGVALCAPFVLDTLERLPSPVGRVEVYRNGELQPLEGRWINQIRGNWDTTAWVNEIDWRPMEEIPKDQLPDIIISHDSVGLTPEGVPRLELGEPCDRQQLPPVLPIG